MELQQQLCCFLLFALLFRAGQSVFVPARDSRVVDSNLADERISFDATGTAGECPGQAGYDRDESAAEPELAFRRGAIAPAPGELDAVVHHDPVVAMRPLVHLAHSIQPNQRGSIHAKKLRRVEPRGD